MLYAHTWHSRTTPGGIYISTKPSTVCCILDWDKKVAKFLTVKKERRVNAFHYVCWPSRIARDRASAMRSATSKLVIKFKNATDQVVKNDCADKNSNFVQHYNIIPVYTREGLSILFFGNLFTQSLPVYDIKKRLASPHRPANRPCIFIYSGQRCRLIS